MTNASTMHGASLPDATRARWPLDVVALVLVVAVAGFFRLWRIDQVPPGLSYDEAAYGHLTLQLLQGDLVPAYELGVFHSYLAMPFVAWLGRTPLAMRLPEALAGIAGAAMLYLYVREAFGSRLAALFAALIYAVTFGAVHVNRLGFPSNTLPLVQAATFYFFWRGQRREQQGRGGRWSLATSGFFLGLAVQSYYAGLAIVAAMGLAWLGWLWAGRRRSLGAATAFWAAFLIPALPWLLVVAPQVAGSPHTSGLFVLNPAVHQGAPWQLLARQALEHAGQFGFTGDETWRHNLPGRPFFELPLALFFWAGVALALWRVRLAPYAFLLIQLLFGILPGALARTDSGPVLLHLTAMIVPACVFPALAADWLVVTASRWRRWAGVATTALFCVLLGVTAYRTYVDYFQTWTQGVAATMSFDELFVATAQMMNAREGQVDAWVLPMSGTAGSDGQARSLDFIYDQDTPVLWVAANDATAGATLQERLAGNGQRIGLVTWDWDALRWAAPAYSDEKGLLRLLLARNGRLVEQNTYDGFSVDVYQLAANPAFDTWDDQLHPSAAAFGDASLALSGYAYGGLNGAAATAAEPVWLALHWQATQPPGRDLKAAVLVVDRAGHVLVQDDQPLRNAAGATSATWPAGASGLDLRLLHLPAGTSPGDYRLEVAVYDAATLERLPVTGGDRAAARVAIAGSLTLGPPNPDQQAVPAPQRTMMATIGAPPQLLLAGYDPLPAEARPGDTLALASYWQALQDAPPAPAIQLELIDQASGAAVQSQTIALSSDYPTPRWTAGQYVTDRSDVRLNRDLPSGVYDVLLAIGDSDALQRVELGTLEITGWPRRFESPAVAEPTAVRFGDELQLVGYTVSPAVAGEPLQVTLCWQALAPMDTSYVTFVHLLDGTGALASQVDAVPGQGAFPTTGWLPGETVCSDYVLALDDGLAGQALTVAVGVYDPRFEQRLPAAVRGEPAGDAVHLAQVTVAP